MQPSNERRSVSYEYQRIRPPSENMASYPLSGPRIVSDDATIRSKDALPNHGPLPLPGDSFNFFSQEGSSAPYPVFDIGMGTRRRSRAPPESDDPQLATDDPHFRPRRSRGESLGDHQRDATNEKNSHLAATHSGSQALPPTAPSPKMIPQLHSQLNAQLNAQPNAPLPQQLPPQLPPQIHPQIPPQQHLYHPPPKNNGNLFSFSEADDSVIAVSPVRTETGDLNLSDDGFENNGEFVSPRGLLALNSLALRASAHHLSLPQKSLSTSLNSNVIGLIIGNYDYSTSLLALGKVKTHDSRGPVTFHPPSGNALGALPAEWGHNSQDSAQGLSRPPLQNHNRNNSESSTTSVASTSSTLTNLKHNGHQRFLRYAMSTQAVPSLSLLSKWLMGNVLAWLDYHGFNESWKETFRRNEISGNRFLELGNYNSNSPVWQQFSHSLGIDGHNSVVERFITLLNSESDDSVRATPSNSTLSPPDLDPQAKAENRKSSSTLWTPSSTAPGMKPRPYSYVDPSSMKSMNKEQVHSHKFFRKHHRNSSTDSGKESPISASSVTGKTSLESVPTSANTVGSRKSGLFSTLRKYGGDKAVGIVKQVQSSSSTTSSKSSSNRKSVYGFPSLAPKKSEPVVKSIIPSRPESQFLPKPHEEAVSSPKSPKSAKSASVITSEEALVSPIESTKLSTRSVSGESKKDAIDPKYYPMPRSVVTNHHKLVMLTKDNCSFVPTTLDANDMSDVALLKRKLYRALDILDIGTITFHLTDFNANPGEPMSDDVLLLAVHQDFFIKIKISQSINSPFGTGTFSSTSSDSKSFDTSGENNGKLYPATPQYLLQDSRDKNVDYLNFKEQELLKKISENTATRDDHSKKQSERMPEFLPLNLSIPLNKRAPINNANSKQKKLPLINTTQVQNVKEPPRPVVDNGGSFSVVRKEGREIDFDKRRQVSTDSKAPRLIPNIYSSSVSDSAVSPISASTIRALKDDGLSANTSMSVRQNVFKNDIHSGNSSPGSELDKTGSFVAKRKAPPPPSKANSLKISNKLSMSSIKSLPAPSLRSETFYLGDSTLSIRLSTRRDSRARSASRSSAFSENVIDFDRVPEFVAPQSQRSNTSGTDSFNDLDDDSFFVKPLPSSSKLQGSHAQQQIGDDDDDDDEFFMKKPAKRLSKPEGLHQMNVRPPVEEVYNNLEKYFPNTNLDKPIIDASADIAPAISAASSLPASRKVSISKTFSNANISPINPPTEGTGDEIFYGDGPKLRRRMKTIRIVANEARIKRLASQRAVQEAANSHVAYREKSVTPVSLHRSNTKLWGQKVVEVTSAEIDKGFVSRMRNSSGNFEEFAWIKGELIGRGSFGSVYLALNVTTGEMLAVKQVIVHREAAKNSEGLEALHKEVETMKDLDHLNIVQYLGFEQKKNTYSLFLEYVAGGSISSCLKSYGKFDEPLVRFITRQVLEGLKYLHSNGILHRDLKADNLLLEIDGTCKISDFGISKKSQDIYSNNAEMSMQGTIFWMAPEVIHSMVEDKKQGYSAKIDIWSLGCVVLEMFAGQRPWSNEAVVSAIYKIGKTKLAPPIPEELSDEAKDFLNKCFTIDSEKRPTAEELLRHLFMSIDINYKFLESKLGRTIKFNSKKPMTHH